MASSGAGQAEQPAWRKSSFCASGECLEVAAHSGMIVLRDSKDPAAACSATRPKNGSRSLKASRLANSTTSVEAAGAAGRSARAVR